MLCPTCNNLNTATTVRCLGCGTTLIYEAQGHSEDFKAATKFGDRRKFMWFGGLAGFGISVLLQETLLQHQYFDIEAMAAVGSAIGAGVGRAVAAYQSDILRRK